MAQRPNIPRHLQPFLEAAAQKVVQGESIPLILQEAAASLAHLPLSDQARDLGELFQRIQEDLSGNSARRSGQVFTPPEVCRHMVSLLEPASGQRWCDPALGLGAFGIALEEILGVHTSGPTTQVFAQSNIEFAGSDLDPGVLPIAASFLPRVGPFLLKDALCAREDLPESWFEGFDRVILNPPYSSGVTSRNQEATAQREILRERFESAKGSFDLYIPFVEAALRLLKPGGRLGAILPVKCLAAPYGRGLRFLLATKTRILCLENLSDLRVFRTASVGTMILVVEKLNPEQHFLTGSDKGSLRSTKQSMPRESVFHVRTLKDDLSTLQEHVVTQEEAASTVESGWGPLLVPANKRRCTNKILEPLGKCFRVQASLSTDEFYTLDVREKDDSGSPGFTLPLWTSGSIDPFVSTWGKLPSRFRKQNWICPVVNPELLSKSRREQTSLHRVLLANLSSRVEAIPIAPKGALGVVSVIQIFCRNQREAYALSAWLNSTPLDEWVRCHFDPLRMNTQLGLTRRLVESIPAPPPVEREPNLWNDLADFAEDVIAGNSSRVYHERLHFLDSLVQKWLPLGEEDSP